MHTQSFLAFAFVSLNLLTNVVSQKLNSELFADYPTCAAKQLYDTFPTKCDYGTTGGDKELKTDECTCHDSDFFKEAALAVYNHCSCSDFISAVNTAVDNCKFNNLTAAMSVNDLIAYVGASQNCTDDQKQGATTSSTPSSTPASNEDDNLNNNNSPKANQIALGVGLGLGLPTLLIGAGALYFQYRAREKKKYAVLDQKESTMYQSPSGYTPV